MDSIFARLAAPFPPEDVKFRPGATNGDKALALAYIDARAVMDRLDQVMGAANWQDSYRAGAAGGVLCRLELRIDGEWIAKEDGADNSDIEAVKGGISDALRRAGVKWGIGRYLYNLPNIWHPTEKRGNSVRFIGAPVLPKWALPEGTHFQQGGSASEAGQPGETRADPVLSRPTEPPDYSVVWQAFLGQCKAVGVGARAICNGFGFDPKTADEAAAWMREFGPEHLRQWELAEQAKNPERNWSNLVSRLADIKAQAQT